MGSLGEVCRFDKFRDVQLRFVCQFHGVALQGLDVDHLRRFDTIFDALELVLSDLLDALIVSQL